MENFSLSFLYIFIIICLIGLIFTKKLVQMTLILFFLSILSIGVFLILDAPDVAITESSISSLTALFSLFALKDTYKENEEIEDKFKPFLFMFFLLLGGVISFAAIDLPNFGNPIFNHYYLDDSAKEMGGKAVVTSILAGYRGYDTLFETCVILIGSMAILFLSEEKNNGCERDKDILLLVVGRLLFPVIILFGLYIQFHGEVSPGGGFQAGAILASAIGLLSLIEINIGSLLNEEKLKYLACSGIMIYYLVGCIGLVVSGSFLDFYPISQKVGIIIVESGIGIAVFSSLLIIFRGMVKQ